MYSRISSVSILAACIAATPPAFGRGTDPSSPTQRVTLDEAIELALGHHPSIAGLRARVEQARARLSQARRIPFNPELEVGGARRRGGDTTVTDSGIGLRQELEIGGQRRKRVGMAEAELAAAESRYVRERRLLVARAQLAFLAALRADAIHAIAASDEELARTLADMTERGLRLGAMSQLEVNLATAELGRAQARTAAADSDRHAARTALASTMGTDVADSIEPVGDLAAPIDPPPSLADLLQAVDAERADLDELGHLETAASQGVRLARAARTPNLGLELFREREEGTDTVTGGGLSIGIPLFNRNQGTIAEARAAHVRRVSERHTATLIARQEVAAAYQRYAGASTAAQSLRESVLGTLDDNVDLITKAFRAGKVSWSEVLILRRSLFEAQRELVETTAAAREARALLELAAGRVTLPAGDAQESFR